MKNLLSAAIGITAAVVISATVSTHLVDSRVDRETRMHMQLTAELDLLQEDITAVSQRLDQLSRDQATRNHLARETKSGMNDAQEMQDINRDEKLHDLIRSLIQEERTARFAATRETQWNRLREWKADREGPYGKHNTRVNSITRSLGLDYSQASYYYSLLTDYEERSTALYAEARDRLAGRGSDVGKFQAMIEEAETEKRSLDENFDQAFMQTLSFEQAGRYKQLPPEERGIGDAGLSQLDFRLGDLGGLAEIEGK